MASSKRPTQIPRWAWGAAATLVQPPSGSAEAGFATRDEPPAQWFNWHFNAYGAWIDFLRGPDVEKWTRAQWPGTPATDHFNAPSALAFDIDTITSDAGATDGAFRMAVVGETSAPAAKMYVSQTGAQWEARTNLPASVTGPFALKAISAGRWLLGCLDGAGPAEIHYAAADDGAAVGPLGANGNSWTQATTPGGMAEVKAFAELGGAAKIVAACASATMAVYTSDNGATWTACVFATTPANNGLDVVSDGLAYVWISQDGEIYTSTDGVNFAATVTLAAGSSASWRLCAGAAGEVVAYRLASATVVDLYYSEDSGASWSAITPAASSPKRITQIAHRDGVWIATVSRSPWLWVSNDLVSWRALAPPVDTSSSPAALYIVRFDGGSWVAVGNGYALVCGRAADPATGAYVRDDAPSTLSDAGSFRGYLLSTATPTNGQVYAWNSGTSRWTPTTPSSGASLPTAAAASEVPVSTGAGTTYTARTMAQFRALMFSQTIDGLAGTGWTTTADPSTSWAWTASTRGRATITGGATGLVTVEHATFLPSAEEYDFCVNLDVSSGDGSAGTTKQIVMRAGQSSSVFWYVALRSDGAAEVGSIDGGGALTPRSMSAVSAIDSTARTGGALWLRLCRRAGRLVALYGISSGAGVLPTVWIELYRSDNTVSYTTDERTFTASQGTWVEIVVYAPSSMVADYEVDFTQIRSVIGGGPL